MTTIVPDPELATDARSLVRLLDSVLDTVVSTYARAGVALPERRYWTLQMPAADCEQLVVSLMGMYIGPPGDQAATPQRCHSPRTATLNVQVLRAIPTSSGRMNVPPSAAAIQSASELLAIDSWLLLEAAADTDRWNDGMPGFGVIATITAGQAQGGFQGPTLVLALAVP